MGKWKDRIRSRQAKELIGYVVFGVLTTLVNILAFSALDQVLHVQYLIANILSWVLAVLFAYVTNKWFVFKTRTKTAAAFWREIGLFFAARLFSLGVDEGGMYVLVDLLLVGKTVSKILMNGIVVVLNFICSKLFIFQKKQK